MTISSEVSKSGPYIGNNVTTVFPYEFKITDETQIWAVLIDRAGNVSTLSLDSGDYTVTGVGNEAGGQIIKSSPLLNEQSLTILRRPKFTQETSLENQGPYYPEVIEARFDQIVMQIQAVREEVSRAFVVSPGKTPIDADVIADAKLNADRAEQAAIAAEEATKNNAVYSTLAEALANSMSALASSFTTKGYYLPGDGGGAMYTRLSSAPSPVKPWHKQSADGAWWTLNESPASIRAFGAYGNYVADDTAARDAWLTFFEETRTPLALPAGNFRVTNGMALPKGVIIDGVGTAGIATFPQYDFANKDKLRPGYKHLITGSNFIFSGSPSLNYALPRTEHPLVTPMVLYDHLAPCHVVGVGFIQDMDVRTADGVLTTAANDNRANGYTAGLVNRSTLSAFHRNCIFGYFSVRGRIHINIPGDDGGVGNDPDYSSYVGNLVSGGTAVWGASLPQSEGNTGVLFDGDRMFGCDHHTRADSDPNIPIFEIDINLTTNQQGRGHSAIGCSFRGVANVAIKLNHCNDISFIGSTTEFSEVPGVPGLDQRGEIVGTANTQNVTIVGIAATGHLGLENLKNTISGNLNVFGVAGASVASYVNLYHERLIKAATVAASAGVLAPTGRTQNVSSTGDPVITSFDLSSIKEGEIFQLERTGSGVITIQNGNNIALWKGWKTIVIDAASDYAVFEKRGSNAFLRAFANVGGGSDNREIPQLIKRTFTIDLVALTSGGNGSTQALTFAEAEFGDSCTVGCSASLQGLTVTAYVSATGSVTLRVINQTGASVDLASATFTIFLFKA